MARTAPTATRPTPGQFITIPAYGTRYRPVPGQAAPLGHHVGPDGKLWADAQEVQVLTVRKARGLDAWDVGVPGRSLRLRPGWEATYLPR